MPGLLHPHAPQRSHHFLLFPELPLHNRHPSDRSSWLCSTDLTAARSVRLAQARSTSMHTLCMFLIDLCSNFDHALAVRVRSQASSMLQQQQ
jgi:hypothetical protein